MEATSDRIEALERALQASQRSCSDLLDQRDDAREVAGSLADAIMDSRDEHCHRVLYEMTNENPWLREMLDEEV